MINLNEITPRTPEEAIDYLLKNLDTEDRHYLDMNGGASVHFSAGMAMRNAWIHPKGSPMTKNFIDRFGPLHPDDMSGMILDAVVAGIQKKPFDLATAVIRYQDYWQKKSINPIEGWDYE